MKCQPYFLKKDRKYFKVFILNGVFMVNLKENCFDFKFSHDSYVYYIEDVSKISITFSALYNVSFMKINLYHNCIEATSDKQHYQEKYCLNPNRLNANISR